MEKLVFIGGVHGVGKTSLCDSLSQKCGYEHITASALIKQNNPALITGIGKQVEDPDANQLTLLHGLAKARINYSKIILDGHFTLINSKNNIESISPDVFAAINPDYLIVLYEEPEVIFRRLKARDKGSFSLDGIAAHQTAEILHAKNIAKQLNKDLYELNIEQALQKIRAIIGE